MVDVSPRPAIDLGRLAPNLKETCGDYCTSYRDRLAEMVRRGERGVDVAHQHARILDGLLGALFCAADAAARGPSAEGRVAFVAVGGYGRGLVGISSDIDVLFLCDDPNDRHVLALAEGLLYPLWDLGLDIGHAVRGVEDTLALAETDVRTATTLLDMRRIGGDRAIVEELRSAADERVFGADEAGAGPLALFLERLEENRRSRHEHFGRSTFLLEPEVKRGCGGLRDLDVARWAAQARWPALRETTSGESRGEADLGRAFVEHGALLAREVQELATAREMLWRVRNVLHVRAGRRQDRLTFEDQEEIAVQLGFVPGVTLAVEQFMQAYYRHARVVEQTAERMSARARHRRASIPAPREGLADGLVSVDGHVAFQDTERLMKAPILALKLYEQVNRRGLPPDPSARQAIARAAADPQWCEALRDEPDAAALFLEALGSTDRPPVRNGSLFAELHDVGLMLAMVPEFEPVTGRVQHDVYHVYTVDVHSVAAVDELRAIKRGDRAFALPLASRLAAELPRATPLFLGLLLHDIGKAHGKDHSRTGARMALPISERLGLHALDIAHVAWLVEEHLSLYHWAMRRDTTDPEVIAEVARQVGSVDRLRDLYLLTVADLSTTNPTAMTSWKARMLEDLYVAVATEIEGDTGSGTTERRAHAIRDEVRVGFVGDAGQAELERFIDEMPDRYLLANPVDAIRSHARVARDRGDAMVHLAVGPGPSPEVSELVVVTGDRPGLLADVAAVLSSQRLTIVAAQIYIRERAEGGSEAFDVFHVRRETELLEGEALDEQRLEKVREGLEALIRGEASAEALLGRRAPPAWARKHSPEVPTEIQVDNDASPRFTVIDVFTRDRVGLLHSIARTLHQEGLTIWLSKINTEGERAADVFYVLDASKEKVRDRARLERLPALLRAAIEALEGEAWT